MGDVEETLRCEALTVGHRGRALLPAVSLSMHPGELWAVIGRNGSGKTTLFRTILGLQHPIAGRVVRPPRLRASYVPQRTSFDELFPVLARDVVTMGIDRDRSFLRPRVRRLPEVAAALERVGATELADMRFRTLSEGQKQRVLLARLWVSRPELALLDEPTAAMDEVAEREAFGVLDAMRKELGTTIVVVSHYLDVARAFADHVVLLDRDGAAVVIGKPTEVFEHEVFRRSYLPAPRRETADA
jgi:zinc transport system ATP-binding protein